MASDQQLLLFVDNFDVANVRAIQVLESLLEDNDKIRWICFENEESYVISSHASDFEKAHGFNHLFIHPLTRKTIRAMVNQWENAIDEDSNEVFRLVMTEIIRANLPRTGYIVSLLLWAIHQKRNYDQVNEAVLIENIVEMLLEKTDFRHALRREFDYRSKVILLEEVAVFLKERSSSAEPNELLEFIIEYFKRKGLNFDASVVFSGFIDVGVLCVNEDNVSFKYLAFQEYFIA